MGYLTKFSGQINIEPPLPYGKFMKSPHYPPNHLDTALHYLVDTDTRTVEQGELTMITASGIEVSTCEPIKAYDIVQQLHDIVTGEAAGHTFSGAIYARGTEWGDIWKLAVVNGVACRVLPELRWPDDTVDLSRYVGEAYRPDNFPKGVINHPYALHYELCAARAKQAKLVGEEA